MAVIEGSPTPKTAAEYQADAAKALMDGAPAEEQVTKTAAPAAEPKPDAPKTEEVKTEVPKAEDKKDEAPKQPEFLKSSFDQLAKEKAENRARGEALKAREQAVARAEALARAAESKDAMALLTAAGFKWSDVVRQVMGNENAAEDDVPAPKAKAPSGDDRVSRLEAELRELKANKQREIVYDKVRSTAKNEKFKYVQALEAEAQAHQYLEAYFQQTGELPVPGDLDASIGVALEVVENNLRKTGEKFSKILTSVSSNNTVTPVAPKSDETAVSEQANNQSKTLTNKLVAPAGAPSQKPEPKNPEDYRRVAREELERLLG